ncbi:hypothetical protein Zm00014a_022916 [Zea mays]|uniref:Uncharacterized protein n=2 Tax=Zea mays TaxID=4577 RepID=A0A3L6DS95_MAIZE|nr:hypothetical protein Zm00014a_022916 [Zea mays]
MGFCHIFKKSPHAKFIISITEYLIYHTMAAANLSTVGFFAEPNQKSALTTCLVDCLMQLKTQDLNDAIVTPKVCSMKCLQHSEVSICESLQAKTNDSYSRSKRLLNIKHQQQPLEQLKMLYWKLSQ